MSKIFFIVDREDGVINSQNPITSSNVVEQNSGDGVNYDDTGITNRVQDLENSDQKLTVVKIPKSELGSIDFTDKAAVRTAVRAWFNSHETPISDKQFIGAEVVDGGTTTPTDPPTGDYSITIVSPSEGQSFTEGNDIFITTEVVDNTVSPPDSEPVDAEPFEPVNFDVWTMDNSTNGYLTEETVLIEDKVAAFETTLNNYPAPYTKELIGTNSRGDEVHGYVVTPEHHNTTIAIQCHLHGNEHWNPVGFITLLEEISRPDQTDPLLIFLRDKVRWVVNFMANPYGYKKIFRKNGNNVDPNRNLDYRWYQDETSEGTAPFSEKEGKITVDFFRKYQERIDFFLDLHDVPYDEENAYSPFHNVEDIYLDELNAMREYLEQINGVPTSVKVPYANDGGTTQSYMSDVFAVPSVTPEHCTQFWVQNGYSADYAIAKSAEQTAAFIAMLLNLREPEVTTDYLRKKQITSFKSEEFGINTWSWDKFHTEAKKTYGWNQVQEFTQGSNPVYSYSNEPANPTKTVVIVAGEHSDDKNSSFVALRVMQQLSKSLLRPTAAYLKEAMETVKIVVVPSINPDGSSIDWTASSEVKTGFESIQTKYNPDYILYADGAADLEPIREITARNNSGSFTQWTTDNVLTETATKQGIETIFNNQYTSVKLSNTVAESSKYAFTVAPWIKAVVNDIVSFSRT